MYFTNFTLSGLLIYVCCLAADVIAHTAISSAFEGMSGACINKHLKPVKLDFRYLRTDSPDIIKIEAQASRILHPSSLRADNDIPLSACEITSASPETQVPVFISDTIEIWKQLEQSTPEDRERERIAYWNWTCMLTKQFELMADPDKELR